MEKVLRLLCKKQKLHTTVEASQTPATVDHTRQRGGLVFLGYGVDQGEASYRLFVANTGRGDKPKWHDLGRKGLLDDVISVAVQLLNGETRYGDAAREQCIRQMLVGDEAKRGAVLLVEMREMGDRLPYSQLEPIVGYTGLPSSN
jgi:hypothetical protein